VEVLVEASGVRLEVMEVDALVIKEGVERRLMAMPSTRVSHVREFEKCTSIIAINSAPTCNDLPTSSKVKHVEADLRGVAGVHLLFNSSLQLLNINMRAQTSQMAERERERKRKSRQGGWGEGNKRKAVQ